MRASNNRKVLPQMRLSDARIRLHRSRVIPRPPTPPERLPDPYVIVLPRRPVCASFAISVTIIGQYSECRGLSF